MSIPDWATTISGVLALLAALGYFGKSAIHKLIESHTTELKDCIEPIGSRLNRIEYALYNDGQTGLINKVDQLIENQQMIKIDVEVIKAKSRNGIE